LSRSGVRRSMCGIAGIVDFEGKIVEQAEIERLTSLMSHRGPDGAGYWVNAERSVALGHRRLAIIDPGAGGYQPMVSVDGRHIVVFNGEIYNFLELRAELERSGAVFRTQSDTEVILAAWQTWREEMLSRFNGMWALAIFDTTTKHLFLARDRFGIKPLLYTMSQRRFAFASEQRALLRSGMLDASIDLAVARRLMFDAFSVEGSTHTLCRAIHRLQAGHFAWLRAGRLEIRRWWHTLDHLPALPKTAAERVEQFGALFRDSVAMRMRSDVPIGTCLSGGFDSSAVICAMAAHERAGMGPRDSAEWRHAFVASFPGALNDERPMAEEAAAWAGVQPSVLSIGGDDALTDLDQILEDSDDVYISLPSAVWLLYRELRRRKVLVSLDGHGADELMGAYFPGDRSGMFALKNFVTRWSASARARRSVELMRAASLLARGHYFLRGGMTAVPAPFGLVAEDDILPSEWSALTCRLYRMFHSTVLPTILRNFDRLSMAHGIEVRMPFMDWRLVTFTMALPDASKWSGGHTKLIARQAMKDRMPESIRMGRRKIGFNSPMPEWLNGPLSNWTTSLLAKQVPAFSELVDEERLLRKVSQLNVTKSWDWEAVGRIWPYLNMKWAMARVA
jgi:asparagine synthase (glutamine-hydrolysing)